jgi:sugar phosphate isomerase/epimerase
MDRQKRREFVLASCATGLGLGLAGCTDLGSDDDPNESDGGNGNESNGGNGENGEDPSDEPVGETIEDFEDLDDWELLDDYGEFEAETDDVSTGSQAMRLRSGEDDPYVGVRRTYDEPLDLSENHLSLAFKAEAPEEHQQIELRLLAPDEENALYLNRIHTGPTDHWMRVDLGATEDRGEPDLSEVTELQLVGRTRNDDDGADYIVDELQIVDAPDQGLVVLTFDDNHETQYTAFEMMEEYGFPGVEGVIHGAVGDDDRLDLEQLREMQDAGWDVVSHPHPPGQWASPLSEFDEDEQREILEESIEWLEDNGFQEGAEHYIAPNHVRDATNLELLREYHESSSSYAGSNLGAPLTDPHTIGRIDAYEVDVVTEFVDLAEKYNQVCSPLWHVIGEEYDDHEMTEDEFAAVLEHVDQADVEVVTQSALVERDF